MTKRKATNDAAPIATALKREATSDRFEEEEYATLRRHYFEPVVVENAELAGGRRLRRQTRPPRIEGASPGFRALRVEIAALETAGERARRYGGNCRRSPTPSAPRRSKRFAS